MLHYKFCNAIADYYSPNNISHYKINIESLFYLQCADIELVSISADIQVCEYKVSGQPWLADIPWTRYQIFFFQLLAEM